jgi:putative ABC transport system ATP-binding protein
MTSAVLELTNVTREFPGEPPIRALDDISLRIETGELAAVVGPSGSGKSTLLNIMGTLDRPTSGSVSIEGCNAAELSDRGLSGLRSARLGFVFQGFHLLESVSALDNVATGLLYRGLATKQRRLRARDALEQVGLGDRVHTKPAKLSGGQRQRVAIARAIVAEPALILADEPTGNLDTTTGQEILTLLTTLNAEGATIVIITHDRDLAARTPRQIRMRDGQIESDTTTTQSLAGAQ